MTHARGVPQRAEAVERSALNRRRGVCGDVSLRELRRLLRQPAVERRHRRAGAAAEQSERGDRVGTLHGYEER